jgi:excisionase family DNA binding protein
MEQLTHKKFEQLSTGLSTLLDIKGLCQYFNISEKTAYNLVRSRDFPSFKVNGKYRILAVDLAKWMEKQSRCRK